MVRVLAVADEEVATMHSRVEDLEVDLVLVAGDLPWDYVADLVARLDAPAAWVPGNHEPPAARTGASPAGTIALDQQVTDLGGLRVAGLGGCIRYNGGDHQYTQQEYDRRAARLLDRAEGPVDLLVTHAPPLGLGDDTDPSHEGIRALHDVIAAWQPTWHLHGHIHPYGMHKPDRTSGSTTIRNVIPWQVIEVERKV